MADKAISELIAANQVTPTDLFVLEQSGTAKKLTGQILENWLVSFADGHGGIQSIAKVSTSGMVDTYRITLADTTTFDFLVTNGKSINSITKTGSSGLVDTYTIRYNDATSSTFTVTNGAKGDKGDNTYTWIKYASQKPTASSHSFGDVPDNWIGIYFGTSSTAPTDWQQYSWFQIKGEKGDTGAAATLLSNVVDYQVSDSGTIIPSGAWQTNVPVVAQGKYLWTRTTTTFNTGSSAVSYSVSRMGIDGSGSVSSVAGISPNADGNVPLTAEDIKALSTSGGTMSGGINMNGQILNGLNAPTANDQVANMGFVNQQVKKAAPRNLLDNSDFTNPVNQRSATSYAGNQYTIDRWHMSVASSKLTVLNNGISITATAATIFKQILDNPTKYAGKTLTFAVKILSNNASELNIRFRINDTRYSAVDVGTATGVMVSSFAMPSEISSLVVEVGVTSGDYSLEWAALYEGEYTTETLPEYQTKGYGAELTECQRYFYRIGYPNSSNYEPIGSGFIKSANRAYISMKLPVTMRVTPTIVQGGKIYVQTVALGVTSAPTTIESVSARGTGGLLLYLKPDTTDQFTAGEPATAQFNNTSNGTPQSYIDISADL